MEEILASVLTAKDQEGKVVQKILQTATGKKLHLIHIDSYHRVGNAPIPRVWLVKNTAQMTVTISYFLGPRSADTKQQVHGEEIYKILLQSIPDIIGGKNKGAERYAKEEAEKRKERKKKEWRGQEALPG